MNIPKTPANTSQSSPNKNKNSVPTIIAIRLITLNEMMKIYNVVCF